MRLTFLISISFFLVSSTFGQNMDKSLLLGDWIRTAGVAGRTIKRADSSEWKLLPVTYSVTTLKLKRFGKAIMRTEGFHGMGMVPTIKTKGNWSIKGDTLVIKFGDLVEYYLINLAIDGRIFLNSVTTGLPFYRRMYE